MNKLYRGIFWIKDIESFTSVVVKAECNSNGFFTVVPDFTSTGVKDGKRLDYWPVIIRAVNTVDAMVCTVPEIDWAVLKKITDRILNEVDGVCRVCFDMSPKPIATIEWE